MKKECGSCAHGHVCSFSHLYQYYLEFIDLHALECEYYREEKDMEGQPVREVEEGGRMKKYIITNLSKDPSHLENTVYTARCGIVDAEKDQDFCDVWEMQKHLFSSGAKVTIKDLDSLERKTFIKE